MAEASIVECILAGIGSININWCPSILMPRYLCTSYQPPSAVFALPSPIMHFLDALASLDFKFWVSQCSESYFFRISDNQWLSMIINYYQWFLAPHKKHEKIQNCSISYNCQCWNHHIIYACKSTAKRAFVRDKIAKIGQNFAFSVVAVVTSIII